MTTTPYSQTAHDVDNIRDSILRGRRLIIASNRGPVTYSLNDDVCEPRQANGGVAVALSAGARQTPVAWVASALTDGDRFMARRNGNGNKSVSAPILVGEDSLRLRMVSVPREAHDMHYNLISNSALWFLQHSIWDGPFSPRDRLGDREDLLRAWDHGYVPVNWAFAEAALSELWQADTAPYVLFHDYHLYVAPYFLRQRAAQATLGHFVHIPWPSPDAWRALPRRMTLDILNGLLACDLVGFQTTAAVRNFLLTCRAFVPDVSVDFLGTSVVLDGHETLVRAYPISVGTEALRARLESAEVQAYKRMLVPQLGARTIVRVDRVDPAKNILGGFQAFELLLRTHPELIGRVRFLAFLVPSREEVPEYRAYKAALFRLVDEINRRWGTPDWQPIRVFYEHNYDQALAALTLYDVLLVNSLADGMNLVAKEGALVNQRDGVIVLSRAAGAFQELGEAALPITPTDTWETAETLADALSLPAAERWLRASHLRAAVETNDVSAWFGRQLADLRVAALRRRSA